MSEPTPGGGSITIAVVVRDRFSPFPAFLNALFARTHVPFGLVVVAGGADDATRRYLAHLQSTNRRVKILLPDHLQSQAESRQWALEAVDDRYCVVIENDTLVHDGWIDPLLSCMRDEGADAVAPLILWHRGIHAAGCEISLDHRHETTALTHRITYVDIRRKRIDYPETHCVLLDLAKVGVDGLFDDVEPFDVDMGLTLAKRGAVSFLEPSSVVTYVAPPPLEWRDVEPFAFRWDGSAWEARNDRFKAKWQVSYDGAAKRASYRRQELKIALARRHPTGAAVALTNVGMSTLNRMSRILALRSCRSYV